MKTATLFLILFIAINTSCTKEKSYEKKCGIIVYKTPTKIVVNGDTIHVIDPYFLRHGVIANRYKVGDTYCY